MLQSLAAASLRDLVANAQISPPAAANGGAAFNGKFNDIPATATTRVAVVVFLHGSSGLGRHGSPGVGRHQRRSHQRRAPQRRRLSARSLQTLSLRARP